MKKKYTEQPTFRIIYLNLGNVLAGSTDNVGFWKDDWFKEEQ